MKILVATQGEAGLKDTVASVFGRAPTFTIVETEKGTVKEAKSYPNKWASGRSGVGIQAAQFAANKGVNAIIAGNIGPNASGVLNQTGIEIVTGFAGNTVDNAVKSYLEGEQPSRPSQVSQRAPTFQRPSQMQPSQRTPSQSMPPQMPMQPPQYQQSPMQQPTSVQSQAQSTKLDIEYQKKMLTLQKRMIKTQIEYLEKKIEEMSEE